MSGSRRFTFIKLKCPECEQDLSQEHMDILSEGLKLKEIFGDALRDITAKDFLCENCFNIEGVYP